ncbi:hypothetical protein HK101_005007, partial [Irineochytrium annulatum]
SPLVSYGTLSPIPDLTRARFPFAWEREWAALSAALSADDHTPSLARTNIATAKTRSTNMIAAPVVPLTVTSVFSMATDIVPSVIVPSVVVPSVVVTSVAESVASQPVPGQASTAVPEEDDDFSINDCDSEDEGASDDWAGLEIVLSEDEDEDTMPPAKRHVPKQTDRDPNLPPAPRSAVTRCWDRVIQDEENSTLRVPCKVHNNGRGGALIGSTLGSPARLVTSRPTSAPTPLPVKENKTKRVGVDLTNFDSQKAELARIPCHPSKEKLVVVIPAVTSSPGVTPCKNGLIVRGFDLEYDQTQLVVNEEAEGFLNLPEVYEPIDNLPVSDTPGADALVEDSPGDDAPLLAEVTQKTANLKPPTANVAAKKGLGKADVRAVKGAVRKAGTGKVMAAADDVQFAAKVSAAAAKVAATTAAQLDAASDDENELADDDDDDETSLEALERAGYITINKAFREKDFRVLKKRNILMGPTKFNGYRLYNAEKADKVREGQVGQIDLFNKFEPWSALSEETKATYNLRAKWLDEGLVDKLSKFDQNYATRIFLKNLPKYRKLAGKTKSYLWKLNWC